MITTKQELIDVLIATLKNNELFQKLDPKLPEIRLEIILSEEYSYSFIFIDNRQIDIARELNHFIMDMIKFFPNATNTIIYSMLHSNNIKYFYKFLMPYLRKEKIANIIKS